MKKADINIVDEAKDTDISLSTENVYPSGEEPDSDTLTLEDAHLTTRRIQGSNGRTSDIHIIVPDDIVADIQAEVGQYLDLNDELRLPLARVSGSAYDIASLLNDKLVGHLTARFTSDGYVMPKEITDDIIYYHTVSIDGVSALREQILEALEAKSLQVMVDHDFLTNIVIGYLKSALPASKFSYAWDIEQVEIDDGVDTVTVNIKGVKKKSDDTDKEAAAGWNLAELTEPGISSNQMTELSDRFNDPNMWESPRDRIASDFNPHAVTSGLSRAGDKIVVVTENRNKYIYNLSAPGYRLTMFGDSIPTLTTAAVSVNSLYEEGADTLSNEDAYLGDYLMRLVRSQSKKPTQYKPTQQKPQKPSFVQKVKDFFSVPNVESDPNNKAGEVEAPYSQGDGPMGTRFDDVTEKGYNIVKGADLMPGGVGDDLPDSLFNPIELILGIKTEAEEHGLDEARATEVAKDHLTEDPEYYSKHAQVDWKNPTPEQSAIREKYKGLAGESLQRHHELPPSKSTEADLPLDRQVELDSLKEVFPASGPAQIVRSLHPTSRDVKKPLPHGVGEVVYKYGDALVVPLEDPTDFWIEWPNDLTNYLEFGIDPTDGKQVVEWTSDTGAGLAQERLQAAKPLNDPWLEPLLDQMGPTIRSNDEGLVKSFDGKWVVQRLGPAQDVRVEDPTDPWYFSSQFPHYIGRKKQAADTPIPESWKRPIDIEEWNNPETPADQASSVIREQFMPDMSPDADISEVEYELPVPGSLDLPADMYNQPIVYMYKGLAWNTPMTAYNPSVGEYRVYDLSNRRFAWLEFSMNRGRPVAEMGRSEYIDPTAIVFEFKQLPSNDALIEKFIDDIGPNELLTVRASQLFTIKDGKWVLIDTAEQAEYLSRDDINILASTHARQAKIIKRKDKWLVTTESGDRVLGTHDTKAEAQAQLSAIEISKHKKGVDKDAVGLIEGPVIDENAYGTDFARADQAIPRPPGKDILIHRK